MGSLILLYVSCRPPSVANEMLFGSLPPISDHENKTESYLHLSGRILLAFMFIVSVVKEEFKSFATILRILIAIILLVPFLLGYKTTLVASLAATFIFTQNMFYNQFWKYPTHTHFYDFYRFEFFQCLSIVGGTLLLWSIGPGNISMDEQKKKW